MAAAVPTGLEAVAAAEAIGTTASEHQSAEPNRLGHDGVSETGLFSTSRGDGAHLDLLFDAAAQGAAVLRLGGSVEVVETRQLRLDRRLAELDAQVQGILEELEAHASRLRQLDSAVSAPRTPVTPVATAATTPLPFGSDTPYSWRADALDERLGALEQRLEGNDHAAPDAVRQTGSHESPSSKRWEEQVARLASRLESVEQGQKTIAMGVKRALSTAIAARDQRQQLDATSTAAQTPDPEKLLHELRPELPNLLRSALPDTEVQALFRGVWPELKEELREEMLHPLHREVERRIQPELQRFHDMLQQHRQHLAEQDGRGTERERETEQGTTGSAQQVDLLIRLREELREQLRQHMQQLQESKRESTMPGKEFWKALQWEAQSQLQAVQNHLEREVQMQLLSLQNQVRVQMKDFQDSFAAVVSQADSPSRKAEEGNAAEGLQALQARVRAQLQDFEERLAAVVSQANASGHRADGCKFADELSQQVCDMRQRVASLEELRQRSDCVAAHVDGETRRSFDSSALADIEKRIADLRNRVERLEEAGLRPDDEKPAVDAAAHGVCDSLGKFSTLDVASSAAPSLPTQAQRRSCNGRVEGLASVARAFPGAQAREKAVSSPRVVGSLAEFASSLWASRQQRPPCEQAADPPKLESSVVTPRFPAADGEQQDDNHKDAEDDAGAGSVSGARCRVESPLRPCAQDWA